MQEEPLDARTAEEIHIANDGAISLSSFGSSRRLLPAADAPAAPKGASSSPERRDAILSELLPQPHLELGACLETDPRADAVLADAQGGKKEPNDKQKPKEGAKKRGRPRLNKKKEPASGKKQSSPA